MQPGTLFEQLRAADIPPVKLQLGNTTDFLDAFSILVPATEASIGKPVRPLELYFTIFKLLTVEYNSSQLKLVVLPLIPAEMIAVINEVSQEQGLFKSFDVAQFAGYILICVV